MTNVHDAMTNVHDISLIFTVKYDTQPATDIFLDQLVEVGVWLVDTSEVNTRR